MKNKKKSFFSSLFLNSKPTTKNLYKLFKPDITDFYLYFFKLSITFTIWIICSKRFGFYTLFSFWEIPLNACVIGFDTDSSDDPFYVLLGTPLKQVKFPHNGYYFYLKLCTFLTLGNIKYAFILSVIIINFFLVYLYRRLLIIYKIGKNHIQLTCFFCLIPTTSSLFHALPTFDSYLFCFICLSLILYKTNHQFLSLFCCFFVCLIRFEGILLPISLLISSIFIPDLKLIIYYFSITLFDYLILIRPYKCSQYLIPGQELNKNYFTTPFKMCLGYIAEIAELMRGNSYIVVNVIIDFSSALLIYDSFPLGIFSLSYFIFFNCISHQMPYRFIMPTASISLICGFESFISSKSFKPLSVIFLPIYLYLLFYLSTSLIMSNQSFQLIWQSLF